MGGCQVENYALHNDLLFIKCESDRIGLVLGNDEVIESMDSALLFTRKEVEGVKKLNWLPVRTDQIPNNELR